MEPIPARIHSPGRPDFRIVPLKWAILYDLTFLTKCVPNMGVLGGIGLPTHVGNGVAHSPVGRQIDSDGPRMP